MYMMRLDYKIYLIPCGMKYASWKCVILLKHTHARTHKYITFDTES